MENSKKWLIRISEEYFPKIYGSDWKGFTAQKRKDIRLKLVSEIDKALKTGKEIRNLSNDITIEELPTRTQNEF